jgi:hypothetical protein
MSAPSVLVSLLLASFLGASEPLPIYACVSIPGGAWSTPARYQELAAAGFTTSLTGFGSVTEALAAMDAAHSAGVTVWVQCPELVTDPATAVAALRQHPAFAGYHLGDEPSAAEFAALAARVQVIQALDVVHPCYINLLPIYASAAQLGTATYQEYIDRFLATVPVPLLSFDHYPTPNGNLDLGLYANLEIVRTATLAAHTPFWGFYQAVQQSGQPARTLAEVRLECYSNLAYGAQGIQAYDYWQTFAADVVAPIDQAGNQTSAYALVQTVNAEVSAIAPLFLGARVIEVAHAGVPVPAGTTAHAAVRSLDVGTGSVIVSTLRKAASEYLVLVNKELHTDISITINFQYPQDVLQVAPDGSEYAPGTATFTLAAGGIVILKTWTLTHHFGQRLGDPAWNPACDLNADGVIDATDLDSALRAQAP